MARLHVFAESESRIGKIIDAIIAPALDLTKLIKARIMNIRAKETVTVPVLSAIDTESEVIKVLERAANDDNFIAQLTYEGSKTLQGYDLILEEKAALLSGDIRWIEAHVGTLDDHLSTWLWCRLQQEIW